jgi:hypothetical protein
VKPQIAQTKRRTVKPQIAQISQTAGAEEISAEGDKRVTYRNRKMAEKPKKPQSSPPQIGVICAIRGYFFSPS